MQPISSSMSRTITHDHLESYRSRQISSYCPRTKWNDIYKNMHEYPYVLKNVMKNVTKYYHGLIWSRASLLGYLNHLRKILYEKVIKCAHLSLIKWSIFLLAHELVAGKIKYTQLLGWFDICMICHARSLCNSFFYQYLWPILTHKCASNF